MWSQRAIQKCQKLKCKLYMQYYGSTVYSSYAVSSLQQLYTDMANFTYLNSASAILYSRTFSHCKACSETIQPIMSVYQFSGLFLHFQGS